MTRSLDLRNVFSGNALAAEATTEDLSVVRTGEAAAHCKPVAELGVESGAAVLGLLPGKHNDQYAVDLVHPHRLVFQPNHDPVPRLADGGIDVGHVTAITIIEVIDHH